MRIRSTLTLAAFLLAGVGLGYLWGLYSAGHRFRNLVDTFSSIRLSSLHQDAFDAYRSQPPEVAIWALNAVVKDYERLIENGTDGIFYTKHSNYADLMLTHGRLSLLYDRIGDKNLANLQMTRALEASAKAYPTESISEEKLREMITRLDSSAKTTDAPTNGSSLQRAAERPAETDP